jgi:hypothetical protein
MPLTLHNRKWYPFIFVIGATTVMAAWLRFAAGHRPELLVSTIGGIAGFTYFLYRQHLDEAKLFKELFGEFNARYDALNDVLNAILSGPREGMLSADERGHLFSYFNLCTEEYFFYKAGLASMLKPAPNRKSMGNDLFCGDTPVRPSFLACSTIS